MTRHRHRHRNNQSVSRRIKHADIGFDTKNAESSPILPSITPLKWSRPSWKHKKKKYGSISGEESDGSDGDNNTKCCSFERVCGIICGSICVLMWVLMSELIPTLSMHANYNKPYLLRFCVGSSYSFMIIIWFCLNKLTSNNPISSIKKLWNELTWNMIWSSFIINLLYNLGGYLWYLSLNATISSINNTIYQSQVAIVYIFSVLLLPNYSMSWIKNLSVLICLIGVAFIGFATENESDKLQENTWYGLIECVIAMISMGLMEVFIKIFGDKYYSPNNPNNNRVNEINSKILLQAMVGISCLFTMWIGIIIVNLLDIEVFELPTNRMDILVIIIPSILDTIYAAAFMIGICIMNPVFIATFQLLVIPMTFIYDAIFNGLTITMLSVFGALFIFIGFLLMEIPFKTTKTQKVEKKIPIKTAIKVVMKKHIIY